MPAPTPVSAPFQLFKVFRLLKKKENGSGSYQIMRLRALRLPSPNLIHANYDLILSEIQLENLIFKTEQ